MKRTLLVIMFLLATISNSYALGIEIRNTASTAVEVLVSIDGQAYIQETLPPGQDKVETIWPHNGSKSVYLRVKSAGSSFNGSYAFFESEGSYLALVQVFVTDNQCYPSALYRNPRNL